MIRAKPVSTPFKLSYFAAGVYQIGDDQARSWMIAGTSWGSGRLFLAASYVVQRGVGISMALT